MKWLKILFWIIILYESTRVFGPRQRIYFSSSATDNRQAILERTFQKYHSPLQAKAFIEASDKYNLDWKILPSVACVESSCGRNYIYNPFGFNADRTPANVDHVAHEISTLPYYKTYRETRTLSDFSMAYNGPFARTYEQKIWYFYNQLK